MAQELDQFISTLEKSTLDENQQVLLTSGGQASQAPNNCYSGNCAAGCGVAQEPQ